jgi:hypothetical protein
MIASALTPLINYGNPINRDWPVNRGLVGWWMCLPQRRGGQRFTDLTANHHGTLSGLPPWAGQGRPGGFGSLKFTKGSAQYVIVAPSPAPSARLNITTDMTICGWFRCNGDYTNLNALAACADSTGNFANWALKFGDTNGKWQFCNTTAHQLTSTLTVGDDDWRWVCATRKGTTGSWDLTLYFNGVFDSTANTATNPSGGSYGVNIGRFGDYNGAANYYATGFMDDIRIYNRCLSDNEVAALYADSVTGYPRGLNRITRPLCLTPGAAPPAVSSRRGGLLLLGVD